jgi:hypothetical protein
MNKFKVGDKVKIVEGSRRGWVPLMDKCIGRSGVIQYTDGRGDFLVVIDAYTSWYFYPDSFVVNKFKGNIK